MDYLISVDFVEELLGLYVRGLDLFAFLSNMIEKACESDLPCNKIFLILIGRLIHTNVLPYAAFDL